MTDAIDRLMAIKEDVDRVLALQSETDEKLVREIAKIERELALVSALAALKAAAADCRHERVRSQVKGAREQIIKALAAA
jgi:hypothetical protein